jgi:hypothetical protein
MAQGGIAALVAAQLIPARAMSRRNDGPALTFDYRGAWLLATQYTECRVICVAVLDRGEYSLLAECANGGMRS